jgi:hypothetical protein
MTQASWPSPSHGSPARAVTDAEYPHLAPWASDGVFQSASDVVYGNSSGLEVHVRTGKYAIVQGHAWESGASEFAVEIAANTSGSTRVDTVVLRLDRSTWDVTAAVRQGTPGAGPPTLQRDAGDTGLWEIPLADVTVDNGAATIASGKVVARTLFQSGAMRPCNVITDIQTTLDDGDMVYEASTGRWIGWGSAGGVVLYEDTGNVAVTLTNSAWSQLLACSARRRSGIVSLRFAITRQSSTFTKSDPDGSALCTLPSQFRPDIDQYGTTSFSGGIGTARVQVLQATGVVSLQHNTVDVTVGRTAAFSMSFPGR